MSNAQKVIKLLPKPAATALASYKSKKMYCPAHGKMVTAMAIPLDRIEDTPQQNPARQGGTQSANVQQILDDLVTHPDGLEEPICVEWEKAINKFEPVFGFNRLGAFRGAEDKGLAIANCPPGHIWASVFTESDIERITLQGRENFDKRPGSAGTKDDVVMLLSHMKACGGFDKNYSSPWSQLDDDQKRTRVQNFVKKNWPKWGSHKFPGVWTKFNQGGKHTKFKTWIKEDLVKHYLSHNSRNITIQDAPISTATKGKNVGKRIFKSGTVVKKGNKKIGYYFVCKSSEGAGALPTHAIRKRIKEGLDELIVVASVNDANTKTLSDKRKGFSDQLKWWNNAGLGIGKIFDKIHWMAQSDKEYRQCFLNGKWAKTEVL